MSLLRSKRLRRVLIGTSGGIVLLVATFVVVLWALLSGSLARLDGERAFGGLENPVHLERSEKGRLTVTGNTDEDLAFGLGFAHAQDRFFQMDLQRRAGEGTLAELLGPSLVDVDRSARRHGLARAADFAWRGTSDAHRRQLEAYTNGVNAGLGDLRVRPWEYLLLRQQPAAWRPVDTYHVVAAMYRDLQREDNDHERALDVASRVLTSEAFAFFTMDRNRWEAPVAGRAARAGEWTMPSRFLFDHDEGAAIDPPANPSHERPPRGSNSAAVGGSYTETGAAMLSNDMHLSLRVPIIWYAARLVNEGEYDVVGVTLPGSPGVVVGSNGHVAWGFTNSYGDWLDHVVLELDPNDDRRHRAPGGFSPLVSVTETIEVAGGDPVVFTFDRSAYGPVVGEDPDGRPLALRWVAQTSAGYDLRLLDMARVTTLEQALDLAPRCGIPHQNLVVASRDGRVGFTIMGRVPRRVGLDGPRPRVWADGEVGWFGWLDPDEVPRIVQDSSGRIWTANARVLDLPRQAVLGDGGYALGARARRIRDRLFALERADEASVFDVQLDTHSELIEVWWRRLVSLVDRSDHPERARLRELLEDWSGGPQVDSVAYRLAREWRTEVTTRILAPLDAAMRSVESSVRAYDLPRTESAVAALLEARPNWVPAPYDSWPSLERAALDGVLERWGSPEQWAARTWGARNAVQPQHPFSAQLPGWIASRLDLPARRVDGDFYVPRVTGRRFGSSQRLVVSPGFEETGILQLPGGPSAHPLSRWRSGDYEAWADGRPVPLLPGPTAHTLDLVPAADTRR